jgi:adenosyl cobinamide kinase/adenosyl cobinamide phosphate guanylyltransferase
MNFEGKNPIFKICNKNKKLRCKTVHSCDDFDSPDCFKELLLDKDEYTQLIPSKRERDIIYVCGASGSGKSTFIVKYLEQINEEMDIFVFSSLDEDETLDKVNKWRKNKLKRVILEDEFDENLDLEELRNSVCVFDDIDVLSNNIRKKVNYLLDKLLQIGRHISCSILITSHLVSHGHKSRVVLNEAHVIVFFPNGLGGRSVKLLLESHIGCSTKQIKKIKSLKSRAVCYVKSYPNLIVYEGGAFVLNEFE